MESPILAIRAQRQLSTMSTHRVFFHHAEAMMVLLCTLFCLATCGPCSLNGMHNPVESDACGPYRDNHNGFQDALAGDVNSGFVFGNSMPQLSLENVCTDSDVFCFPSTLPGLFSGKYNVLEVSSIQSDATSPLGSSQVQSNLSWSSDCGAFKLLSGGAVYCSLNLLEGMHGTSCVETNSGNQIDVTSCRGPLLDQKNTSLNPNENSETIKSGLFDGSSSPHVEISPPVLDWGHKYLYFPSLAFLTVVNMHSDSILNVYEPYSTNAQFYPCNFSEFLLAPGEVASICFVFLATCLGLSSAHIVLQTSAGGFLIQAKGFAVESPYGIQPLIGLDVSSGGRWSKNLSLFNPFNETLYVEEVTAWISVSSGNTSHLTKGVCSISNFNGSDELSLFSVKKWLDVKSGQLGLPLMAMKPHRNWEVGPHSTETIIELDFSHRSEGKIFGAFYMQLLRSSKDKIDTVMVPLEAELGGKSSNDLTSSVSASLEVLVPCDASGTVVAFSLRNIAPYLLSVVKISIIAESTKSFQIKYIEGLILFPGTVTQVAVVSYTPLAIRLHDAPPEIPKRNINCKFLIQLNDSASPQIEIPCNDIVSVCSRHQLDSYVGYEHHSEKEEYGNERTWSLGSSMQSQSQIKALQTAEADELVLKNWQSHATCSGMSVLDDCEVLFPMVEVGTHHSKWITVKNPSPQPVVMQLVLNSAQIVDECLDPGGLLQPSSSSSLVQNKSTAPSRYGFSIAESALTEAYVHPYGRASFGPILFLPSNRCVWRSSAMIRNNLSGVEWLSLQGFGGLLSLVLLEGSEPIQSLEFMLNLPSALNVSPPGMLYNMEYNTHTCSQPLSKELYAKNMGDLPLEVRRIEVSGTQCGLDGFVVHICKGFALEPGESKKLLISYSTDLSAAVVQRDLELALATGILVVPMKASLPMYMLNFCKKSLFWVRVKKFSVAILLAASIMFLVFCFILPQVMAFGSQDYLTKGGKNSIATIRHAGKSSRVHRSQKNGSKFSISSNMNGLCRPSGEEEVLMLGSASTYPDGQGHAPEEGITAEHLNPALGHQRQFNFVPDTRKDVALPSPVVSKSVALDSSEIQEASQPGNLIIKIKKDKGRRRKKKRASGTGLTGLFEVSSSQSGNSTPSSPLSPVTSMPKRSWLLSPDVAQSVEAQNLFTEVADRQCYENSSIKPAIKANILEPVSMKYGGNNWLFHTQERPSAARKMAVKPVLLPSATFPCTGRPAQNLRCPPSFLASTSTIAPHVRAPGSKLYDQKTVKNEEKTGLEDEFKYDIWGNHLFGLHLAGRSNEVYSMSPHATKSSSDSFFVRGPQTLVANSQPKSVSSSHQDG